MIFPARQDLLHDGIRIALTTGDRHSPLTKLFVRRERVERDLEEPLFEERAKSLFGHLVTPLIGLRAFSAKVQEARDGVAEVLEIGRASCRERV